MTRPAALTTDDSADPGFARTCPLPGAVHSEDFTVGDEPVEVHTPSDDLPRSVIEGTMAENTCDGTSRLHRITGFWPNANRLDCSGPTSALYGIAAHLRQHRPDAARSDTNRSVKQSNRHPEAPNLSARAQPFPLLLEIA